MKPYSITLSYNPYTEVYTLRVERPYPYYTYTEVRVQELQETATISRDVFRRAFLCLAQDEDEKTAVLDFLRGVNI
jgi:hypothetical protein